MNKSAQQDFYYLEKLYEEAKAFYAESPCSVNIYPIELGRLIGYNEDLSRTVAIRLTNNKKLKSTLGLRRINITEYGVNCLQSEYDKLDYNSFSVFYISQSEYDNLKAQNKKFDSSVRNPYLRIQKISENENSINAFIQVRRDENKWQRMSKEIADNSAFMIEYNENRSGVFTFDGFTFYEIKECLLNGNDIYEYKLVNKNIMNKEPQIHVSGGNNFINNIGGENNASTVQVTQTNNTTITNNQINDFLQLLKADVINANLNDDTKADINEEIQYAERQLSKQKDTSVQLLEIGKIMKDVGINVFANVLASPIFEYIKPLLGM